MQALSTSSRHLLRQLPPLRCQAAGAVARMAQLDAAAAKSALDGISTVVLDCDGVLWRGNDVIEGVDAALPRIRAGGRRVLYVTNNSQKTRQQYADKFAGLGLQVSAEDIITSAYAAAEYLAERQAPGKALLLGTPSVQAEMQALGVETVLPADIEHLASSERWDMDAFAACAVDPTISAVVVAFQPEFSYRHLAYASAVLRENPGCVLIATNPDAGDVLVTGRIMPGTGCMVAAVALASGAEPIIVGKGGSWLLPFLCQKYGVQPEEACMIGDRLDTDVAFGKSGGWRTILTLTGMSSLADVEATEVAARPDYVIGGIVDL